MIRHFPRMLHKEPRGPHNVQEGSPRSLVEVLQTTNLHLKYKPSFMNTKLNKCNQFMLILYVNAPFRRARNVIFEGEIYRGIACPCQDLGWAIQPIRHDSHIAYI